MRKLRKAKIIATLGPASNTKRALMKMFRSGFDVARLNFSHGTHSEHLKRISIIRSLNKSNMRKVKIMQDLEGYRMRIGRLKRPIKLDKGMQLWVTNKDILGTSKEISFIYNEPITSIKRNTLIYIDDGKIILKVKYSRKAKIKVVILSGGILKERKGLNIPGKETAFGALTDKDREDVKIAIKYRLDYLAQSFVRSARDIRLLKRIVKNDHPRCKIFAKVENRKAIKNIDEIISESDGIIIARGDLGISVPIYQVPILQKEIIKKCRRKKKPVVVATQMLESMTEELIPTRAEATDVANAILDGADYLLLSGETATGNHPDEVIKMMNRIIGYTERFK
jgi:pyruvate kinase